MASIGTKQKVALGTGFCSTLMGIFGYTGKHPIEAFNQLMSKGRKFSGNKPQMVFMSIPLVFLSLYTFKVCQYEQEKIKTLGKLYEKFEAGDQMPK